MWCKRDPGHWHNEAAREEACAGFVQRDRLAPGTAAASPVGAGSGCSGSQGLGLAGLTEQVQKQGLCTSTAPPALLSCTAEGDVPLTASSAVPSRNCPMS